MVIGAVDSNLQAVVELTLVGPQNQPINVNAIIDTGFNGFLTLPLAQVRNLECEHIAKAEATLADGSTDAFELFLAEVIWDGRKRVVEADSSEGELLIGMAMMRGHDLSIRITDQGEAKIEAFVIE
ncbi:MAG: clan AA aspartic protease [Planctomycetota bacterium]|nr:clan AA aspartic protease [Planctomycetota bacterium]